MYVDEVGNHDLDGCDDPRHRHLSLTGVILGIDYARDHLTPAFDDLKRRYFVGDPDDPPIILHRSEIKYRQGCFQVLRDDVRRAQFDQELFEILERTEFTVITAVIDKLAHREKYKVWRAHPYHYCLEVLVERFVMWLKSKHSLGDVMAERRGKTEDKALKKSFGALHDGGTQYVSAQEIQRQLSSHELKIRPKTANIAGLQLADIVAHPSWRAMRRDREGAPLVDDFGARVARLLERSKYRRSATGQIDRYGRKWLP